MSNSMEVLKSMGMGIKSTEEVKQEMNVEDRVEMKKPVMELTGADSEIAVRKGLIPFAYKDAEFDENILQNNVTKLLAQSARKFKVPKFDVYKRLLSTILTSLRTGVRPKASYIIGAPNGFGKTSFVNTAIKIMLKKNWNPVPYISLYELAELKMENEKELLKGMSIKTYKEDDKEPAYSFRSPDEFRKMPQVITGCYSWSEYMNSDVLFTFFTSIDSKLIESNILKMILDIRSAKGLPTIVFISTSLNPYKQDNALREYIWDEILTSKEVEGVYDRVYHVSTWKQYTNIIGD